MKSQHIRQFLFTTVISPVMDRYDRVVKGGESQVAKAKAELTRGQKAARTRKRNAAAAAKASVPRKRSAKPKR